MHLYNPIGQKVDALFFENGIALINPALPSGVYFFQVLEKGNLIGAGELMIKQKQLFSGWLLAFGCWQFQSD